MYVIEIFSSDASKTIKTGESFGRILQPGDSVFIYGDLGAGKTTFIKGIAKALGIHENEITSASFVIIAEHYGRYPLYHIDLYRLSRETDTVDLGLEEYIDGDGVAVVEWAERLGDWDCTFKINICIKNESERIIKIMGDRIRLKRMEND
jgi:tRNA threonylcarbamoyladenosine biosynthesis protein TsaE